jgi:hypothetical protein
MGKWLGFEATAMENIGKPYAWGVRTMLSCTFCSWINSLILGTNLALLGLPVQECSAVVLSLLWSVSDASAHPGTHDSVMTSFVLQIWAETQVIFLEYRTMLRYAKPASKWLQMTFLSLCFNPPGKTYHIKIAKDHPIPRKPETTRQKSNVLTIWSSGSMAVTNQLEMLRLDPETLTGAKTPGRRTTGYPPKIMIQVDASD